MKEKFDSFTPFLQAVLLFTIGAVSFILISIIVTLVMTISYPEMPVDNLTIQLKSFPVQYMFINFMPFQLGFLLTPGIVYSYLTKDAEKIISKPKLSTIVWSLLLFVSVFFLLPFISEINLDITKFLGVYEGLVAAKEIADEQLTSLVGKSGSMSFFAALLIIGLITGIAEEFAFRRFLFHHMLNSTKKLTLSLISSSVIFALLHFNYIQILPLFSFGLVLGMMYYVSGSIIPGIIMHALNNILNVYWLANDNFPSWMNELDLVATIPATVLLLGLIVFRFQTKNNQMKSEK
ncbi:CPBP family intramembrane metalloprotease [Brumimicrobium glaciale]|uniref:CPBP family intramembrane metalloprotease n=1 Tax=Brumimicrobium glaciale TaxID=200475 RepID=A0A4Q4KQ43_9FLAO|nr:CPBP family intramembrane glutamic endopeptidase [Brumimicrobium glaciale]RYM35507.1 CPBP family intramembrane metalloprotease [Brumimicrobium glaciale]